ncbi:MAG: Fic family protein [Bacilli bacterium]|nr:Fic family protein [Bacilli bacterium]
MLNNKLNITSEIELSKEEERITKLKALELFDKKIIDQFEVGTFNGLSEIHKYLFDDIYDFAGKVRNVNLAKGNFRFASVLYLDDVLDSINKMPQTNFDEIIDKYIEMNIAHPFREGNGRSTRIWLDLILRKELSKVIDWSKVNKEDYLLAMERSPVRSIEIKKLLNSALTDDVNNREIYMRGIDVSYQYEGYYTYSISDLDK